LPGTTRDIVESNIKINGVKFNFFDVAGIRDSKDPIEAAGIKKAIEKIDYSDIVLQVMDNDSYKNLEKSELMNLKIPRGKIILVFNKIDQLTKSQILDFNLKISETFKDIKLVQVSAKENLNIDLLENALIERVREFDDNDSEVLMTSNRQYTLSKSAIKNFIEANNLFEKGFHLEIVVEEIRAGIDCIGQITGEISNEDIYDALFSNFCIGK
jgi:tRNA modification GTPase